MLYYIRQEIIGQQAECILEGSVHTEIELPTPRPDCERPAPWWDEIADKSLLIGVFKHGKDVFFN